jgi:riboflavin kinase / FMN adenylyltransferase
MRITTLDEVEPRPRRVAVGEFDGIHLGHRAVIAGSDTVLTFEPHPLQVLRPEAAPQLLTRLDVRAELAGELGVEEVVVIDFDDAFAHRDAQDFVDRVLVERLQATVVSVGENFRFGHGAQGDVELLRADPRFQTRVVPLVEVAGAVISSSHLRRLVQAGEVAEAAKLLGAPFRMRETVVHGDERGRELGFPTANLVPDDSLVCPAHGVYACWASFAGERHPAAVNVGVRPTFSSDRGVLVEAHLLDWSGDLYDRELTLEFLARLRGEQRFADAQELIAHMRDDVAHTRIACAAADDATDRAVGGDGSATVPGR